MPPNKNPRASVNPGIIFTEKYAIAIEVKNTNPKPKLIIDLRHFFKLSQLVYHAASNSSGGKKTRNTKSGWMLITGIPGTSEIANPPITNKMG
ncbi:hypothetical protein D3C72_1961820 [compost metagenome]